MQTVVAERRKGDVPRVLGVGIASSSGVRRGVIVDLDEATNSIRQSVQEAERASGVPIKTAWLGVGGIHISVSSSRGVVAVSRADGEISPEDARRAIAAAETFVARNPNKGILHIIPRDFKVDNESGIKDPIGMHGVRLEVDTLIIECSTPFLKNLFKCVEGAGLSIQEYIFSPFAASCAVLTKRQKELGVMLLDVGGGTASFMIFEEGTPIHAGVIPIGGNHITNDVAIGFRTHIDVAERIKIAHGSCLPAELPKRDSIRLAEFIPEETAVYSKRELAEIIEARLGDIFELLQKELKKIGRLQLLPAGVVLVGGSSLVPGMVEFTRREIKLPVELGVSHTIAGVDETLAPSLASALGIIQWANNTTSDTGTNFSNHMTRLGKSFWMRWIRALLP